MKIAILGAPGSGKTKFANRLAKSLRTDEGLKIRVIDNYAQRIQKSSGLALGPWASYSENFMVAGERMQLESAQKADYQITCGTIIDTIVYAMVKSDVIFHNDSDQERRYVYAHAQGAVNGLSVWYTETWNYDIGFFLPLEKENKHRWTDSINDAYSPVVESFLVPNIYSLEGDQKERAEIASKVIEIFEREQAGLGETEASEIEQQTVRSGNSDGEDGGNSAKAVPDVPID